MADSKKYFQFNITPKLGVTLNQIHLEQRQRVLDRLNSKQQFKNGGTLTQFLLKEGKL